MKEGKKKLEKPHTLFKFFNVLESIKLTGVWMSNSACNLL